MATEAPTTNVRGQGELPGDARLWPSATWRTGRDAGAICGPDRRRLTGGVKPPPERPGDGLDRRAVPHGRHGACREIPRTSLTAEPVRTSPAGQPQRSG